MKKLMLIVPSMRGGGSERVMSILANNLDRRKFDITLVLLKKEGPYLKDLSSDIKIIDINSSKARYAVYKLYKLIKKLNPDILFSTLGHLNILISMMKIFLPRNIKYVARESSIVSINNIYSDFPKLLNLLYKLFYNRFDLIISQSKYMKYDLIDNFKIKQEKIIVINNPVENEKILSLANEKSTLDHSKINLLNIGSLTKIKNQEVLLEVINNLSDSFHLTILGTGVLETELKEKIKKLKLEQKVTLKGFEINPYKYLKDSDCLLITSLYEGFPNVALEAITCSVAVIAFNSKGGISEIIKDGENGYLVDFGDIQKMTDKINLLSIEKEQIYLTSRKYHKNMIIKKYEKVLELL